MNQTIELHFDEANLAILKSAATSEGLTPEQFAEETVLLALRLLEHKRGQVGENRHGQSFQQAMQEVLRENEELFRRLAR